MSMGLYIMYSGITQGLYAISSLSKKSGLLQYGVSFDGELLSGLKIGASVNIDGVCQTVTKIDANHVFFDAMAETLRLTTLSDLAVGQRVSVERSLKIGDEHGGHDIYGHIYGTAVVEKCMQTEHNRVITFCCDPGWMKYLHAKGFVAINGSSLTVASSHKGGYFTVHLIPETLKRTNFAALKAGDEVNIELDAKTQAIVNTVDAYMASIEQPLAD